MQRTLRRVRTLPLRPRQVPLWEPVDETPLHHLSRASALVLRHLPREGLVSDLWWRLLERWSERRMARRYWHQTPWRSCNQTSRGLCLRCFLRDITGTNRRARAAHVKYVHEVVMPQLTPIKRPRPKR